MSNQYPVDWRWVMALGLIIETTVFLIGVAWLIGTGRV